MSLIDTITAAALSGLLVKGTVLLFIGWLGTRALRRAAASARHVLWLGVIVAVLVLPALAGVGSVRLPVLPTRDMPPDAGVTQSPAATNADGAGFAPATLSSTTVAPAPRDRATSEKRDYGSFVFSTWLGVTVLVLGWIGAGMLVIRRIIRGARDVDSAEWSSALSEAAKRLAVSPPPRLLMSDQVETAFAWDVLSPTIVLPASAAEWSSDRRRAVLLHELAHVRRRDLAGHLVASIACAVYWFHPLVWLAARRLRAESELACDDVVLRTGLRASDYAQHLLDIVAGLGARRTTPAFVVPMARSRDFEGRLQAILERANRRPLGRTQVAVLVGFVALLTTTIAAIVPVPRPSMAPRLPEPASMPQTMPIPPIAAPLLPASSAIRTGSTEPVQIVLPKQPDSAVIGADTAIAPQIFAALGPCDRTFGAGQVPAIVDSAYLRLFDGVVLAADRQRTACELLASLHFEQAAIDSIAEVAIAYNRAQTQAFVAQQNVVLRSLLSSEADRTTFDARVAQGLGGFGGFAGGRGRGGGGGAVASVSPTPTPAGGFRAAAGGGGGGGGGARGRSAGGTDTAAVAGVARGGGGIVTMRPVQPLFVIDGTVITGAQSDSMRAALQAAAAKTAANATFQRLFADLSLTSDQEATARDVITATQQEIRGLPPVRRLARLRLAPVAGSVSMQAGSADEIVSLVSDEVDRAKVRSRIVIIRQ